jgi:uncharacterized protein (DUF58 family)
LSLPPEILKKVKLIEISTRKMVNNLFAGEFNSAFRGQGMTFSEFREYVPGDDVRAISWPVTARTGKPYIKIFDEEREMTLLLAVDVSGSSDFGTGSYFKGEVLTHVAALLGYSAAKNKDPVGLLLFSDQVEHYVPPKKGRAQIHRIIRDLLYFEPKSRGTKISVALEHLQKFLKKKTNIFIASDFMDKGFEPSLRMLANKHETVAVIVNDPAETTLPELGVIDMEDAETGELITVDTSNAFFRREYEDYVKSQREARDQELKRSRVDRIYIDTHEDIANPLLQFFRRRNRR